MSKDLNLKGGFEQFDEVVPNQKKTKQKQYFKVFLSVDTINDIYDLHYTKKITEDMSFTQGEIITEAIEMYKQKYKGKIQNAPENFKGQL